MDNIETGYKCRMIKEWSNEKRRNGSVFNFRIVNDIHNKIEKNWVLTDKQHDAINNIYKKFKIDRWCIKKNQIRQYDDGDEYTWKENICRR
jgi:hypothetical protein